MTYNVFGGTLNLTQLRLVMWSVYGIFIPVQVKPLDCPEYNAYLLPLFDKSLTVYFNILVIIRSLMYIYDIFVILYCHFSSQIILLHRIF